MRIVDFAVRNYKSIRDTGVVRLGAGFNVVVGQNNAGKTALGEALSLRFGNNPHRSLASAPTRLTPTQGRSQVEVLFELRADEAIDLIQESIGNFLLPFAPDGDPSEAEASLTEFLSKSDHLLIRAVWTAGAPLVASLEGYEVKSQWRTAIELWINPASRQVARTDNPPATYSGEGDLVWLPHRLAEAIKSRLYVFRAERLNLAESVIGPSEGLAPNASNLAQVLHQLQSSNTSRFQRLNRLISTVILDVTQVTVPPYSSSNARISVWTVDPAFERDDLAVSLTECGTGIGQVLAMLYIVLTSEHPRIIVIDEPQSFLHPGAIRKLFDVLRQHAHHDHQYILTTHSPAVITAAEPSTLLWVRKTEGVSSIATINAVEAESLTLLLSDVGARLADVFGADAILWVEGRTEELCFPLIIKEVGGYPLLGTVILGVEDMGDLVGRQARDAYVIYRRLSQGSALMPPVVGFVFDRESRSPRQQEDLIRESRGAVRFLPRRMYENYLLNPHAIADVASSVDGFATEEKRQVGVEDIEAWFDEHRWEPQYFGIEIPPAERTVDRWLQDVDGAKILQRLFIEMSGTTVTYEKTHHGLALTRWLIANAPDDLRDLSQFLVETLQRQSESQRGV